MSTTRQEKKSVQNDEWLEKNFKIVAASIVGGIFKSSVLYIPSKFSFYINTADQKVSWSDTAKAMHQQGTKFFYGLDASFIYSSINYMVFFGFQLNFHQVLAEKYPDISPAKINSLAATLAAVCTTYTIAPLGKWKQDRMLNCTPHQELWQKFWEGPLSKSWRGSTAKVITDTINTGVLYSAIEFFKQIDQYLQTYLDRPIITPTLAGAMSGFLAALASNPFAVLFTNQRNTCNTMLAETIRIYQNKGIYGFYPHFLGMSAINGVCGGIIVNHIKCYLEKLHFTISPAASSVSEKKDLPLTTEQPKQNREERHTFFSLSKTKEKNKRLVEKNKNMLKLFHQPSSITSKPTVAAKEVTTLTRR